MRRGSGGVAERLKAVVLKTTDGRPSGGSNPSPFATPPPCGRRAQSPGSPPAHIRMPSLNRLSRRIRRAKCLRKNLKLAALAAGGWPRGLSRALGLWRGQGVDGLRRALAVLEAQTELSPEAGGFDPDDYAEWVRRYDTLDTAAARRLRRRAATLPGPSRISLILLPGESGARQVERTLRSVRAQVFGRWELIAAPEAWPDQDARASFARHAVEDPRVRRIDVGHSPAATAAEALERASGAFTGFLRAGDELPLHALFCAAQRLGERPDTLLFYADEDRADDAGARNRPWFKPDRNPELMLARDMFAGLCLLRTHAALEAGGPRDGYGPWMVYELAWRMLDRAEAPVVTHGARVLCHRPWSPDPANPAAPEDCLVPPEQTEQGLRAAQEHLDRAAARGDRPARAVPAPGLPGRIRALYERPGPEATVSIIIPTRDRADLLGACVRSVREKTARQNVEIVVIDNGSTQPETLALFEELRGRGAKIVRDDAPFNYSRLNNEGAAAARGEYLCLMNNDIEALDAGWLDEMLSLAVRPGVGCVGARLLYPDGTLQHGGIVRGMCGFAGHAHLGLPGNAPGYFGRAALVQEFSAVTAACLLVRRTVFDAVEGLDETLPESYNDVDFCLRVRAAGYRNLWTPHATLLHRESASRRDRVVKDAPAMNRQERRTTLLMRTRWGALAEDPAYNPNLTRRSCDFGLAWPPRTAPLNLL